MMPRDLITGAPFKKPRLSSLCAQSSMDFESALKAGGASATMIAIVGIGIKLFQSFCGKRLRSECCGAEGTMGVSVEEIPRGPRPSIEVRVLPHTPALRDDTAVPDTTAERSLPPSPKASPLSVAVPASSGSQVPPLAI